jgi:tetratricopeptide (TPR) repeat protein
LPKDIDHVAIPSTIQDVIMARVDSLTEAAKEVLQAGSAIEREFSYGLIKAVTELPEPELLSHLSALKDSELLYERGIFPQATFIFRHALTREVVYDSILAKRRKLLHEKIGNTIEQMYADSIGDHYGGLVEHFLASEGYEKAAKYARFAGKKAVKAASFNEAISFAENGIFCLERLPADDEFQKKIIDARTILALYLNQMGDSRKAKETIDPIMESAKHSGYTRRLAQMCIITGCFHLWAEEDLSRAAQDLARALKLAEQSDDLFSVATASFFSAWAAAFDCKFQEAFAHIEKVLNINSAVNSLWGASLAKSNQSWFQWFHGQIELSYRTSSEGLKLAEQSGDIYSNAWAHTFHGVSCFGRGAFQEASQNLSKGIRLGERISQIPITSKAYWSLAEVQLEMREYEMAAKGYRHCIGLLDSTRSLASWSNLARLALEKTRLLSGEKNVELEPFRRHLLNNRVKIHEGWTRRYLGEILMIIGNQHLSEAQHWIEQAIEADKRNQMMFHLGRDHAVYSEVFKKKGDREKAREQLGRAIDIYKECGADGWVTRAEAELAKLS